jgi:hypothetical protein
MIPDGFKETAASPKPDPGLFAFRSLFIRSCGEGIDPFSLLSVIAQHERFQKDRGRDTNGR